MDADLLTIWVKGFWLDGLWLSCAAEARILGFLVSFYEFDNSNKGAFHVGSKRYYPKRLGSSIDSKSRSKEV